MAETLCGPSNPLQSFQKHAGVDRTAHQDRLRTRGGLSQDFRSAPGTNAGLLDAEFEAFQSGVPLAPIHPEPPLFANQTSFRPAAGFGAPEWASDFQKLQISRPTSSPVAHQVSRVDSPHSQASQDWHRDFLSQQNQTSFTSLRPYQSPAPSSWAGSAFSNSIQQNPYTFGSSLAQPSSSQVAQETVVDNAAFEKAFDAVQSDLQHIEEDITKQTKQDISREPFEFDRDVDAAFAEAGVETKEVSHEWQPQKPVNEAEQQEQLNADESDELAQAANQLLESVSDDQSTKFRESSFLALMRRLRDHEVHVEGETMVESNEMLGTDAPRIAPEEQDTDSGRYFNPSSEVHGGV